MSDASPDASPERYGSEVPTPHIEKNSALPLIIYPSDELKRIGEDCSRRLPPASAVQAMFLYEMQRETETEKLFHHQMFRLARAERQNQDKEKLIENLSDRLTKLEVKTNDQERDGRLATSLVRMQSLAQNLQDCIQRLSSLDIRVAVLQNKVHDMDKEEMKVARLTQEIAAKQIPDRELDELPHKGDIERIDADVESLYKDNRDIWEDRHATQLLITDLQGRITKLEALLKEKESSKKLTSSPSDSVRALTPHVPASIANQSTAMGPFNFPSFQQASMMPFYPMGPPQYWSS